MITIEIDIEEGKIEVKGRKGSGKALMTITQGPCQDNNYTVQDGSVELKYRQLQELRDSLDMVL